jgi:hypothetical protein
VAHPHGVCVYSDHAPLVDVLNRAGGGLAHSASYLWAAKAVRAMQYDINGHGTVRPGDVSDLQGPTLEIRHIPGSANLPGGLQTPTPGRDQDRVIFYFAVFCFPVQTEE